jgi:hypothetical protein
VPKKFQKVIAGAATNVATLDKVYSLHGASPIEIYVLQNAAKTVSELPATHNSDDCYGNTQPKYDATHVDCQIE